MLRTEQTARCVLRTATKRELALALTKAGGLDDDALNYQLLAELIALAFGT